MTAERNRAFIVAAAVFVCSAASYATLGITVSHLPPTGIDLAARGVTGEAPAAAWIFTESCLWPVLTVFGIAGCAVAFFAPAWRARIAFALVTTLATWQISNALKDIFRRPRPDYWIVHHETTFAYSSGHAMFAILVYCLWAYFLARSDLPRVIRIVGPSVLGAWGAAVIWSRLALGAHYVTDLLGGVLLAICMLAAASLVSLIVAPRARIA